MTTLESAWVVPPRVIETLVYVVAVPAVPVRFVVPPLPETLRPEPERPLTLQAPEQPAPVLVKVTEMPVWPVVYGPPADVGVIEQLGAALMVIEYATGVPLTELASCGVTVKLLVPVEPEGVPEIAQFPVPPWLNPVGKPPVVMLHVTVPVPLLVAMASGPYATVRFPPGHAGGPVDPHVPRLGAKLTTTLIVGVLHVP